MSVLCVLFGHRIKMLYKRLNKDNEHEYQGVCTRCGNKYPRKKVNSCYIKNGITINQQYDKQ